MINNTEKKVDSIIRWLERFKKSYSSGAKETALMDAQCARADLEDLSLRMFREFGEHYNSPQNCSSAKPAVLVRAVVLSLIVILMTVTPLARDIVKRSAENSEIVITVKHDTVKPDNHAAEIKPLQLQRQRKSSAKQLPVSKKKDTLTDVPKQTRKSVAYDRVFSLVETGKRALRPNSSVINLNGNKLRKEIYR